MKTVRKISGRPRDCPRVILQSSGEKHFSTKFHHFCAKYFSSFRNFAPAVLDTVTTECAHTLHESLNTHREPGKNICSQNKLATSENKPNKNRKVMFNSEIFEIQTSQPPHAYYSISSCRRQKKLYESWRLLKS